MKNNVFYAILLLSLLRCKMYSTIYYYYITMKTSQSNPMTSWDELLAALDNAYVYARKATDGS